MKLLYSAIALGSVLCSTSISAATFTVGNLNNPDDSNAIFDNAGNLLTESGSATVFIGIFDGIADASTASVATLQSSFQQYGNSIGFGAGFAGSDGDGLFSGSITGPQLGTPGGADFETQSAFLIIGNGTTVTSSTQLLIFDTGIAFADSAPFNPSVNLQEGSGGTVIFGEFGNFENAFTGFQPGVAPVSGFNLASVATAVPEPSSIALLGLGVVGFVIRRRR